RLCAGAPEGPPTPGARLRRARATAPRRRRARDPARVTRAPQDAPAPRARGAAARRPPRIRAPRRGAAERRTRPAGGAPPRTPRRGATSRAGPATRASRRASSALLPRALDDVRKPIELFARKLRARGFDEGEHGLLDRTAEEG